MNVFLSVLYFCVSGGNDKNAVVFNRDTEQVMAILKGHTKKVTSVIYHPEEVSISNNTRLVMTKTLRHKTTIHSLNCSLAIISFLGV